MVAVMTVMGVVVIAVVVLLLALVMADSISPGILAKLLLHVVMA